MTEKEYQNALNDMLFRARAIALRAMVSGSLEELHAFKREDVGCVAIFKHIEELSALRQEDRYKRCMDYMETTRDFWQSQCGIGRFSVELAQKCWEREAREKFGYTLSEWATPCYNGSGKPPLVHPHG